MTFHQALTFFIGSVRRQARGIAILVACTICSFVANLSAQSTHEWNLSSPFWENSTAWDPAGPPTGSDIARFDIATNDTIIWTNATGNRSAGQLHAVAGNYTFDGNSNTQYELTLISSSPEAFRVVGNSTVFNLRDLHIRTANGGARIEGGATFNLNGAGTAGARFSTGPFLQKSSTVNLSNSAIAETGTTHVGASAGVATLNIASGADLTSTFSYVGHSNGFGTVNVTGPGSTWTSGGFLSVGDTSSATGVLNVSTDGVVTNSNGYLGRFGGADGTAIISSGGQWNNNFALYVGQAGTGTLTVESGGIVNNTTGHIGDSSSGDGTVTVTGSGSQWNNSADLDIASSGTGVLNIDADGLVTVGGTTFLGDQGAINLNGGRFEFGQMSFDEFGDINAVSGSMAGTLQHAGYTNANTLTSLQPGPVDITDVMLANTGTLFGSTALGSSLDNATNGEVETIAGERLRFMGAGTNSGEFNNFGGQIRFDEDVTNQAGGFITGRGQFIANGGWTNQGVMAFSGGVADVIGDVVNDANGQIVTSGNSTTTFYDDVVHNGTEIRTAAGSSTVFFGAASGAGPYTGTGTVFFEGDLRPGNSPDIVSFEGDVVFGADALTVFELGGRLDGEYDRLEIAGDLVLDGMLEVQLIDGHMLRYNKQYLIADVAGALDGSFSNFGEGDLVGSYDGIDLFVSYTGGTGNDVTLLTAVPEPGLLSHAGLSLAVLAILRRRKRC